MTQPPDTAQRAQAIDPSRSFIVEAPAGSGKTELLIQRFLKLLAGVERPEQIIAITFTRKAAAEMRQRVLDTFNTVAANKQDVAEHRKLSLKLASDALAHARRQGWSLIDQPRRLRIMTIDSLNAALARQMPILASGTVSLNVTDDTSRLYSLAARRTTESLSETGELGDALRLLLATTDNSLAQLERLLAGSLAERDRWLREFAEAGEGMLAVRVAASLARLADERLAAVRRLLEADEEKQLLELLRDRQPVAADRPDEQSEQETNTSLATQSAWLTASRLLLTAAGEWRQRFTRREGFPADNKKLRAGLKDLLAALHAKPGLKTALAEFAEVPASGSDPAQPALLAALERVLPRLLAELRVLFAVSGSVDHTEVALAAQQALGAVDQPSELLFALDRRIEHILVDEFQDTSHLQWRLLEQLTAGWQAGDGRSLFLVGDPMQSIYRFRDADVSLFLKARQQGLGGVDLEPIELQENHRSAAEVVDWVNAAFSGIFPADDAIDTGVPGFRAAISMRDPNPEAGVAMQILAERDFAGEVSRVVSVVENELARDASQSIGILVRSRSHLAGMRAALGAAGLAAHTIEIDSLADTQLGQDLIGFTSALLHPGDRLGWLGLLRSPWCGLDWVDLLALAGVETEQTIRERLADTDVLANLSQDGAARATWLSERLESCFARRAMAPLGRWVRDCWVAIDGPAALADQTALGLAERYFSELDGLARHGDLDDPASLRSHFARPAAGADVPTESGIEIMTMHRAKGLEFDTVILPGLGRTTRGISYKLLFYQDFQSADRDRLSLLAATGGGPAPFVEFLKGVERQRDAAERGRLLYVAATRARHRLHLIGSVDQKSGLPRSGSLLATLWPGLAEAPAIETGAATIEKTPVEFVDAPIRCLRFGESLPQPGAADIAATDVVTRPEFEWVRPASVQVGTLIHRELQRLADQAARKRTAVPPEIEGDRYQRELALLGVESEDLSAGARRVAEALENVWNDATGRWILNPWPEAWSELRLTVRQGGRLAHIQLDRSFVDDEGRRWIIDFKTGQHLGSQVDQFLDNEVERYRGQLERYAQAVAEFDNRPLRVGLYFPLMTELRDWEPAGIKMRA
jgi:ATP-dependent exoDNAse (exonuclease V) beta subunit